MPFQAPRKQQLLKKMANYGYGWYNEKQLEDYYNKIIGNFFNIVSIAKLTISLCLLHFSLRWPRQDPREEDLHRCQEDHLPGGCQVRRHPCLDWWDPHGDLQPLNLHSPNPQSTSRACLAERFSAKNGDPPEAGKFWENRFFTGKMDHWGQKNAQVDDTICQGPRRTCQNFFFIHYCGRSDHFYMASLQIVLNKVYFSRYSWVGFIKKLSTIFVSNALFQVFCMEITATLSI